MHRIVLENIKVRVRIGVTDRERKRRQRIRVSIELFPEIEPDRIKDSINNTINYSSVRQDVIRILSEGTNRLIETAAHRVAEYLKEHYRLKLVRVTVKKYPYRDIKEVSYTIEM